MKTKEKFFFCFLFLLPLQFFAQDYLKGFYTEPKYGRGAILYDRTQLQIAPQIFQTIYKIFENSNKQVFTITATHDRKKSLVLLSLKEIGGNSSSRTITYDRNNSALIFTERGNTDTVFTRITSYSYLFSFADTLRDFAVLHEIKSGADKVLELDPLSKIRLKKNAELVVRLLTKTGSLPQAKSAIAIDEKNISAEENLSIRLQQLRDSLHEQNRTLTEKISEMRKRLETDLKTAFGTKEIFGNEKRYSGEKQSGYAHGKGWMIDNGTVYAGEFKYGRLRNGTAVIRRDEFEYTGNFERDTFNGTGFLKLKNGTFYLGNFSNGLIQNGIALEKEDDEIYFGNSLNGLRNGYGELRTGEGNFYFGEFISGKLVSGYSKETDKFGYTTYSKIESGDKKIISSLETPDIFSTQEARK